VNLLRALSRFVHGVGNTEGNGTAAIIGVGAACGEFLREADLSFSVRAGSGLPATGPVVGRKRLTFLIQFQAPSTGFLRVARIPARAIACERKRSVNTMRLHAG